MTAYEHLHKIEYDVIISPHSHALDISNITNDTSPTYDTWFLKNTATRHLKNVSREKISEYLDRAKIFTA